MTPVSSNLGEQYVQKVMAMIYAPEKDRARIQADLQSHLQEGLAAGEDMAGLVERMGDPRLVAAEFMSDVPMVYAGFGRRLAAFLVDMLVLLFFGGIAAVLAVSMSSVIPQHPLGLMENILGGILILLVLISANACIAVIIVYFPLLEGRFGQTLGKRLLGIVVRAEDGLPAGYWQTFLRRLSFYFEMLPFDALFIPFTARHQRAFDILARTIVIRAGG
jgi:uncharacterized RDD family membrane protein YckC